MDKLSALMVISLLCVSINTYKETLDKHDHFKNIKDNTYVLSIFVNSVKNSKLTEDLRKSLDLLENSSIIKDNNVILEYIDLSKVTFLNKHYKLKDETAVKFFVRGQMINYEDFARDLRLIQQGSNIDMELPIKLLAFVDFRLKNISTEVKHINQFNDILKTKKIIGYFCGPKDNEFDTYFKVASRIVNFNFVHNFDPELNGSIFQNIIKDESPEIPFFAIIRHSDALNEFDNQRAIILKDFNEKTLTEFIDFERYDKLRNPASGNEILKNMFSKIQPLLLYVKSKDYPEHFEIYKNAIKELPKQFIYTYTGIGDITSGPFLQLHMMADKLITPNSLSIIWVGPSKKVKIETYKNAFEKDKIIEFVVKFYNLHNNLIDSLRSHLYTDNKKVVHESIISEEL